MSSVTLHLSKSHRPTSYLTRLLVSFSTRTIAKSDTPAEPYTATVNIDFIDESRCVLPPQREAPVPSPHMPVKREDLEAQHPTVEDVIAQLITLTCATEKQPLVAANIPDLLRTLFAPSRIRQPAQAPVLNDNSRPIVCGIGTTSATSYLTAPISPTPPTDISMVSSASTIVLSRSMFVSLTTPNTTFTTTTADNIYLVYRRIGCFGTISCDVDIPPEHEDVLLVRLSPGGGSFENVYIFCVWEGVKFADTKYWLESGKRKFWWMFEDDVVDRGLTEGEKRMLVVEKGRVVEVKPECRVDLTAVA
jgi:hypothetical protein